MRCGKSCIVIEVMIRGGDGARQTIEFDCVSVLQN
jgi:hypothetical protein